MESLSGPERERAWTALSAYVLLKTGRHVEETGIAKRVSEVLQSNGHEGFSSEEGMYEQFKRWGLPGWISPKARTRSELGQKRKRKARRAKGEAEKLPPPLRPPSSRRQRFAQLVEEKLMHLEQVCGRRRGPGGHKPPANRILLESDGCSKQGVSRIHKDSQKRVSTAVCNVVDPHHHCMVLT